MKTISEQDKQELYRMLKIQWLLLEAERVIMDTDGYRDSIPAILDAAASIDTLRRELRWARV